MATEVGLVAAALVRAAHFDEDVPQFTPHLDRLWREIDEMVGPRDAAMIRVGSVAGDKPQADFYYRVAASPAIRTICETGFNAGHSAALWLSANPTAHLHTFDIFGPRASGARTAEFLRSRFPGRLTTHKGDSARTVPLATLHAPCDLVHVDGRHDYEHTMLDALNLFAKASPHALFLFDDQCDPHNCSSRSYVPGLPTMATCDLHTAGVLRPIFANYNSARQFLLSRANTDDEQVRALAARSRAPLLPCSRMCWIQWTHASMQRRWVGSFTSRRKAQRLMRPQDCNYTQRENRSFKEVTLQPDPRFWVLAHS